MLDNVSGFGCTLRDPVGVATRCSGTIINLVALNGGCSAEVQVVQGVAASVKSNHRRFDVEVHSHIVAFQLNLGVAKW